jgi:phenylpropionate dioxygenase-like ring-hydroxylating dioxygenase large terminal subunit
LIRQPNGSLTASLNVCRHRGARVAEGCGSGAGSFSCPYHGWTYGLGGTLVARPDERSFTGFDRATAGLRTLPVVEKYGMVWICPTQGAIFEVEGLLGGLATDFAAYGFDAFHHYETRVLQRRINWKLAVDTFLESYHIGVLHHDTIGPLYYSNRSTFDGFGRNLRWVLPRRTIGELRNWPEDQWDLIGQTIIVYLLFPNILVMVQDHLQTWHIFPAGNGIDEARMYVSLYTPEPALTDSARRHWNNNFDLLMGDGRKSGLSSFRGYSTRILFRRPGRHYFRTQRACTAALSRGPQICTRSEDRRLSAVREVSGQHKDLFKGGVGFVVGRDDDKGAVSIITGGVTPLIGVTPGISKGRGGVCCFCWSHEGVG